MGACLSNEKLPENVFVVRNIHDDNRKFPKGIIEVTQVELKYKDAQSGDEWVWPLKYLRKYGCDRDIFSFEAGRKCPGGEGLYAFSTKKASQLFDMVARNISEGGLEREEGGAFSPPGQQEPSLSYPGLMSPPSPNPPPPPVSNPPSHPPPSATPRQPEYTNLKYNEDGLPVHAIAENGHAPSLTPPPIPPPIQKDLLPSNQKTPSPPPRVNYTEVEVARTSKSSLELEEKEVEKRVSYSEIDINKTEEYKQKLARDHAKSQHPMRLVTGEFTIVPTDNMNHSRKSSRPPSASSAGTSTPPSSAQQHRSMSEGNFSQHKGVNGAIPGRSHSHSSSAVPDAAATGPSQLYQNVNMSKSNIAPPTIPEDSEATLPQQQPNYMNIVTNPGLAGSGARRGTEPIIHRDMEPRPQITRHESDVQATYQNLTIGPGMVSPTGRMAGSPPRASGSKIAAQPVYVQLDLGPKTSTPNGKGEGSERNSGDEDNHMTLNFSNVNSTPRPMERSQSAHSPPPAQLNLHDERSRSSTEILSPSASSVIKDHLADGTTVNYSTMNFDVMQALRLTKEQREQEIRERLEEEAREKERREKEEAANPKKKKKEKGKKKDRRNSHQ